MKILRRCGRIGRFEKSRRAGKNMEELSRDTEKLAELAERVKKFAEANLSREFGYKKFLERVTSL